MPVSGAMDQAAYRLGNLLAGNAGTEASLEIIVGGFTGLFLIDTCFAVTGAEREARLNNRTIATWTAHQASKGDVLSLAFGRKGARWYVAVAGGLDVPPVMGSRSTYLRGGFGGLEGRALQKGDVLESGPPMGPGIFSPLPAELIPNYSHESLLRVILGPQDNEITEQGLATFLRAEYNVTQRSDRMGCLLAGPPIEHKKGPDIISDATAFGSIQVPGSGQPIILMADRQTMGGYVKVATVASIDLPLIAQTLPGNRVRFKAIGIEEAQELYIKKEKQIALWLEKSSFPKLPRLPE